MKRVVLNRKNSLFVGNARGGRTAAILSSFTATCRRHGIDPWLRGEPMRMLQTVVAALMLHCRAPAD